MVGIFVEFCSVGNVEGVISFGRLSRRISPKMSIFYFTKLQLHDFLWALCLLEIRSRSWITLIWRLLKKPDNNDPHVQYLKFSLATLGQSYTCRIAHHTTWGYQAKSGVSVEVLINTLCTCQTPTLQTHKSVFFTLSL